MIELICTNAECPEYRDVVCVMTDRDSNGERFAKNDEDLRCKTCAELLEYA